MRKYYFDGLCPFAGGVADGLILVVGIWSAMRKYYINGFCPFAGGVADG